MLFSFSVPPLLTLLFASDLFDLILSQFSQAMVQAIHTSHPLCNLLPELLEQLCNSGSKSKQLTEMAYEWCSVICAKYSVLEGAKDLLLLSLEIGFRCIDPIEKQIEAKLIHTEYHQRLASIIFSSGDSEAIADLLCAWTSSSYSHMPYPQLKICAEHLIGLHHHYPFSSRLQLHIIYAIGLIRYQEFEQVGVEDFVGLLNDLQTCAKGLGGSIGCARLLLDTIKSSEGIQHLSLPYWELLVDLAAYWSDELRNDPYIPYIMASLEDAREWDKLECWITIVWLVWPPEGSEPIEEDLKHVMLSLSHQQPGVIQKLEEQMEQWSSKWSWLEVPKSFQQICKQAHDEAAQQGTL